MGGKYRFDITVAEGDAVEWVVLDESGGEVFRSSATADSGGSATSDYWKTSEVGEYSVVRYVNGEETARKSLVVRSPYALFDTYYEDFAESVAAYFYPDVAQARVERFKENDLYRDVLYYADYTQTRRWAFVQALIEGTIVV